MEILKLPEQERAEIFRQIRNKKGLDEVAAEKDVWVTAVLRALFELPYSENISFKGGTSLSKCFNLIERFSEDIDIAINREYFGFMGETFTVKQVSKLMRKACCKFCRNTLQYDLAKQMLANNVPENLFAIKMNVTDITTIDPEKIFVEYKSVFDGSAYIKNVVVLEINGRSMKEPLEKIKIRSFIDEVFANQHFVEEPFEIQVVSPERTFLEKVCLLHEEFSKQSNLVRVERMSRHLYDIARMIDTPVAKKALNNKELYKSIIAHRRIFIAMKNFDYDTLLPEKINIVPPKSIIAKWEDDYKKMQTMIYGEYLAFNSVIDKITHLNEQINRIKF
ncbi:MAG: nucleotidyl transferase AbiEii/AbiGii toxin family protein [Bacteroidales bacterium]|jgi:predicted nucleotidyltransferase component of viral defense system|nr:nucleotidyl transferase AbiEii/AbiGii toxin family protein [Bacteroidales bacterium]